MPSRSNHTPRTGLHLLIDWANERGHWVRAIVTEVIAARHTLADQIIGTRPLDVEERPGVSHRAPHHLDRDGISVAL